MSLVQNTDMVVYKKTWRGSGISYIYIYSYIGFACISVELLLLATVRMIIRRVHERRKSEKEKESALAGSSKVVIENF